MMSNKYNNNIIQEFLNFKTKLKKEIQNNTNLKSNYNNECYCIKEDWFNNLEDLVSETISKKNIRQEFKNNIIKNYLDKNKPEFINDISSAINNLEKGINLKIITNKIINAAYKKELLKYKSVKYYAGNNKLLIEFTKNSGNSTIFKTLIIINPTEELCQQKIYTFSFKNSFDKKIELYKIIIEKELSDQILDKYKILDYKELKFEKHINKITIEKKNKKENRCISAPRINNLSNSTLNPKKFNNFLNNNSLRNNNYQKEEKKKLFQSTIEDYKPKDEKNNLINEFNAVEKKKNSEKEKEDNNENENLIRINTELKEKLEQKEDELQKIKDLNIIQKKELSSEKEKNENLKNQITILQKQLQEKVEFENKNKTEEEQNINEIEENHILNMELTEKNKELKKIIKDLEEKTKKTEEKYKKLKKNYNEVKDKLEKQEIKSKEKENFLIKKQNEINEKIKFLENYELGLNEKKEKEKQKEIKLLKSENKELLEQNNLLQIELDKIRKELLELKKENKKKSKKQNISQSIMIEPTQNNNINININNIENNYNNNERDVRRRNNSMPPINKKPIELYIQPTLIGLNNIGATCYMNATLQCLSQTEDLTNYFLLKKSEKYINSINEQLLSKNECCLSKVYLELVQKLWDKKSKEHSFSPKVFMETVTGMNPLFKKGDPGDSKDFIIFILEQIHRELKRPINSNNIKKVEPLNQYEKQNAFNNFFEDFKNECSIISDVFFGFNETTNICLNCKNNYNSQGMMNPICYNYGIFNCIIIPLEEVKKMKNNYNNMNSDRVNLIECFQYNQKSELFFGENKNYCNVCRQLFESIYTSKIYVAPNNLIIILNRGKGNIFKVKLDFTLQIDITDFVELKTERSIYDLYGIITHIGESGPNAHFIASCRSPVDKIWYRYNDSLVSVINDLQRDMIDFGVPYILFYQKHK